MRPHVTFHINKKLDKQMVAEFLKYGEKAGYNFATFVLEDHPKLKGKELDRNFINQYVDDFYLFHKIELAEKKKVFQKKWDIVEVKFLDLVDSIFKNQPWPDGKYKGYISIIQCGPRFLANKEFQSSYKWERNLISQVIHEMLHFQFYQTVSMLNIDLNNEQIWTLSEIFNDIVQQEDAFTELQGYKVGISYPDHIEKYEKFKSIWEKDRDVKKFIDKGLKALKTQY